MLLKSKSSNLIRFLSSTSAEFAYLQYQCKITGSWNNWDKTIQNMKRYGWYSVGFQLSSDFTALPQNFIKLHIQQLVVGNKLFNEKQNYTWQDFIRKRRWAIKKCTIPPPPPTHPSRHALTETWDFFFPTNRVSIRTVLYNFLNNLRWLISPILFSSGRASSLNSWKSTWNTTQHKRQMSPISAEKMLLHKESLGRKRKVYLFEHKPNTIHR